MEDLVAERLWKIKKSKEFRSKKPTKAFFNEKLLLKTFARIAKKNGIELEFDNSIKGFVVKFEDGSSMDENEYLEFLNKR